MVPIQFMVPPEEKEDYEKLCLEAGMTMTDKLRG